jgi:two-component system, NtrC family, response regulator AtoC
MPHALLVDDDVNFILGLSEVVGREGFTTRTAHSLKEARAELAKSPPDVVLVDLHLPDGNGLELFKDLETSPSTEIILITGQASVDTAVESMRKGASDYLVKPVDMARVKGVLANVVRTRELKEQIGNLRGELRKLGRFGPLIGAAATMQRVYDLIAKVASTEATVMLLGETGTGKELVAETIHGLSRRHKEAFLPVNCGAVSPNLIESELFGHERGSFTGADRLHRGYFERANRGTLFLDEITEMPPELQVKLLRVLETGSFTRVGTTQPISADVRLIAATNRNPESAVADGKLREDLYHRINVFPIAMPPLRDRGTDIELLAQHFLEVLNRQESASKSFAPATIAALYAHSWPGNVRELKNYVQRAFILADDVIDANLAPAAVAAPESAPLLSVRVGTTLDEVSRRLIEATLAECGSKRKAADMLGISLKTLYNRLAAYKSDADSEDEEQDPERGVRERHAA